MTSNNKNQCNVDCPYKINKKSLRGFLRFNKPLCSKFHEVEKIKYLNDLGLPEIDELQYAKIAKHFENYKFPRISKNGLVIVETRQDERLKIVLKNIAYYVPNWKLHIFHSTENKLFIQDILKDNPDVALYELENPIFSNQDYNKVLLDNSFWNKLTLHERVLIFQTDTLILKFGIENFLDYDYIGAAWPWWSKEFSIDRMGGNGGFSIRKVSKMLEILNKNRTVKSAPIRDYQNEDIFFSYHLYKDKTAKLPNWNKAMLFSSEHCFCINSLGLHQTWKFHKDFKLTFD